jgi:hypothetical protein
MRVEYSVKLGGRDIVVSNECESDSDVFKFLYHMQELFDDCVCVRNGQTSDKVRVNVRTDKEDNEYYEMVCYDQSKPECNYAKRVFGQNKKGGGLFPKSKDEEGNWKPWRKYNKETGKED